MSDVNMALSSLHEMIRNLSTYIKSLEVLCESGVTLAKNFERLLSPGPGAFLGAVGGPSSGTTIDSDMLTQSVATWELAGKVATADSNGLISELLPLLQETVQSVMRDPASFNSANTYEVFRSCFSAFFQIQWRFCQLYISCASSAHGSFLRSPDTHMARSPTMASFSSSASDRRESTESCMSGFSMPRSSFSGVSSFSSRSSSPGPGGGLHLHPFGRSRTSSLFESSPSVKFTPSQPPSPLMPYGEGSYQPYLFRRWSAHTHAFGQAGGVIGGGGSSHSGGGGSGSGGTNYSSIGGYGSGSSLGGGGGGGVGSSSGSCSGPGGPAHFGLSSAFPFSRRWSVPASVSQPPGSTTDSGRRTEPSDIDYGLLDAINLLSTKPPTPSNLRDIPLEESRGEYDAGDEDDEPQTTSLWPPSETMPGVVLTTCGSDPEAVAALESLQQQQSSVTNQSLRVPFGVPSPPTGLQTPESSSQQQPVPGRLGPVVSGIQTQGIHGQSPSGEYTLFGNTSNPARN